MTPVYEVKTKHTRKMLEDFVGFTFRVKHPATTFSLAVLALCFYTLAYVGGDTFGVAGIVVMAIIGTIILVFDFNRKKIAASKLAKCDPSYQNQTLIHFVFGEREFTIEDDQGLQHWKYGEIPYMYADDKYFFVSINNEMMHLIPKGDFTRGTAEQFYDFISDKTGKVIQPTYIPWKTRIRMMMEYRDARAEAWEEQEAEKKANKKNKK